MTPALDKTSSPDATRRAGWKVWTLFSPLLGWLLLFVVAPTLILAVYSFFHYDGNSQVTPGFTLEHYRAALSGVYLYNFFVSSLYAGGTTILCALIGYPVAYFIGRSSPGTRNRLLMLVMIPFLTSFLIRTFAWVAILNQNGVLNKLLRFVHLIPGVLGNNFEILYSRSAVMIALVYTYLPFMILPIYGSVEKLDQSLIEAASDLGASPLKAFRRVILPLTLPGISAGALMVFVPAVAMFAVTHVMSGGKIQLIGDKIEDQFLGEAGNIPFGSALGMVLLIAFIVTFYLFTRRAEGAEAGALG
ncbi:MAG TPA: ABC transporter permease [Tepidisphaeraceae bacterium]|jgi:spermidine/putrescine transport system permease protein|nr:ABC transporter permease [Tepidisphaeraceae bacterium]